MAASQMGNLMDNNSRWARPWAERPVEEARLFNPAFCGELIGRTVVEFHAARQQALEFTLAYLVIPLVLHRPTREILPTRANKAFAGWTAEHSARLVELPDRTVQLRPITSEALMFAVRHELLMFRDGELVPGAHPVRLQSRKLIDTEEVRAVRKAASLLGRWFARQGTQTSVLRGMGVAP